MSEEERMDEIIKQSAINARAQVELGTCQAHVNPNTPHLLDRRLCVSWRPMDWNVVDVADIEPSDPLQ